MTLHIDTQGNLHDDMGGEALALLPFGCRPATQAEIDLKRNPSKTPDEVWLLIKAKRTTVELGGVKVGTKWYHTDDASRIKYLGLFKLAEQALAAGAVGTTVLQYNATNIRWKTMDNTFIDMTVQRAQDVFNAVFGLDLAAFGVAEMHRAAVLTSPDPGAYNYNTGWPLTFTPI